MGKPRNLPLTAALGSANFLAAFGGGTVLSTALEALKSQPIDGASLFALVAGSAISLPILREARKSKGRHDAALFSLITAALSLVLFVIWRGRPAAPDGSIQLPTAVAWGALLVFVIRWSTVFVCRSLRAETAGFYSGQIQVVECLFFLGMTAGLFAWRALHADFSTTLIVDGLLQTAAAGLDRVAGRYVCEPSPLAVRSTGPAAAAETFDEAEFRRVAVAAATMTAGLQMGMFAYAEYLESAVSKELAASVLAAFYAAGALAAGTCGWMRIEFGRDAASRFDGGWIGAAVVKWRLPLPILTVGATGFTIALFLYATSVSPSTVVGFVLSGAFCLATVTMTLLNHASSLAKRAGEHGKVAVAYGLMGLFAAVTLLCLSRWKAPDIKIAVALAALAITTIAITRLRRSPRHVNPPLTAARTHA